MAILRSHHIAVQTPNLQRLVEFYTDVLGMPQAGTLGSNIVFVDIGGTRLEFIEKPEATESPKEQCKGPTHIAFEVDDVEATYQDLLSKGVQFHIPPRSPQDGLTVAFFKDPDGNVLELFHSTTVPPIAYR